MANTSIIVPVYNVAPYLDACIASIQAQTYTDWELLLIDDGSTDDSAVIAQRWQDKDPRIRLYRKPNGGVSSARNFGLDRATGEYIMFVDSDDLCHPRLLEYLRSCMVEDIGIVGCMISKFEEGVDLQAKIKFTSEKLMSLNSIYACYSQNGLLHPPYGKIYRNTIIRENNIRFIQNLQLGEDVLFNLDYLKHISTGVFINLPLYFYRDTPASLSKRIQKDYSSIQLRILSEKMSFTTTHNVRYDYAAKAPLIVRDIALTILRSDASREEKSNHLNALRNHRIMEYCKNKGSFSDTVLAQAIKILPSSLLVTLLR